MDINTPQYRELYSATQIIFAGLHRNGSGKGFMLGAGNNHFYLEDIYQAFYRLSKEFPQVLPGYDAEVVRNVPVSLTLENMLNEWEFFRAGPNHNVITITLIEKKRMKTNVIVYLGESGIERFLPLAARFAELMKDKDLAVRRPATANKK